MHYFLLPSEIASRWHHLSYSTILPPLRFFTTNLLLHFFAKQGRKASREAAAFAAIASLRLQDPLHPLKSLHKLQRSSCFQLLKVQGRPSSSRRTANRAGLASPATVESTNYSANLQCSFKADFLKKYVGSMSLGPWDKRNTVQMA